MNITAHNTTQRPTPRAAQRLCLLLLPMLAVLTLLLPITLLDRPLRADGTGGSGLSSSSTGSSLKAPKNSGGFVINLPNSSGSTQRVLYTTGFAGETLAKTYSRHMGGQLNFSSTTWGTEVTNPSQDQSGRLATFGVDGKSTVRLLLPSKDFALGGLVSVESQKVGSGSKKGPQIPTIVYFTITSDNLVLDVPAVIAAAKSGNLTDFTLRFYNLQGKEKVRVDLQAHVDIDSVQVIF